jgi:hypothetical protein
MVVTNVSTAEMVALSFHWLALIGCERPHGALRAARGVDGWVGVMTRDALGGGNRLAVEQRR